MALSALLGPLLARADDGEDDSGPIQGREQLDAKVLLVPTDAAPGPAGGVVKIEGSSDPSSSTVILEVKTRGLDAGDYDVSAVRISDGSSVDLGQFTVGSTAGDDEGEDSSGDSHDCGHNGTGNGAEGELQVALPDGLLPSDIAQIVVSDSNGQALLIGDFQNPVSGSKMKFRAVVSVEAGSAAPHSTGKAQLLVSLQHGRRIQAFTLSAKGVPARSRLILQVNNQNVGTVSSNRRGQVVVSQLPQKTLAAIETVKLRNGNGQLVAKARF